MVTLRNMTLALVLVPGLALAKPDQKEDADGVLGNRNSTLGLCTPDNAGQHHYDTGLCKTLYEFFVNPMSSQETQMRGKTCGQELMKRLHAYYLREADKLKKLGERRAQEKLDKSDISSGIDGQFPSTDPRGRDACKFDTLEKAMKNELSFTNMVITWIAAVAEKNSSFKAKYDHGNGQKGIFPLDAAKMDDEKYACGCNVTNSKANASGASFKGESPGPTNPHHNIMCGAYIMLHDAVADGKLYDGRESDPENPPKGAAKLIPGLREPKNPPPTNQENPFTKYLKDKMGTFCKANLKSPRVDIWTDAATYDADTGITCDINNKCRPNNAPNTKR